MFISAAATLPLAHTDRIEAIPATHSARLPQDLEDRAHAAVISIVAWLELSGGAVQVVRPGKVEVGKLAVPHNGARIKCA